MGFLHESEPLSWEDAMSKLQYVRSHGIEQFVHIYDSAKNITDDLLRWGDEIEHNVFRLVGGTEDGHRTVKVSLRSPEIIERIKALDKHGHAHGLGEADMSTWMPEFGRWMLESTPGKPYEGLMDVLKVERQMRARRSRLLSVLQPDEIAPTVTGMPLFGVGDFCDPAMKPRGPVAESLFVPDEAIFPHPRFAQLTKSIRERRGSKVGIRRPLMTDKNTPQPKHTDPFFVPQTVEEADAMDHIYADSMAFGMGNCCLQVTFQASSLSESRRLYDHLAVLTPLFLALTAASPFLRGWICDEDTRWGRLAESVDDRTPAERGQGGLGSRSGNPRLAGDGVRVLRKSRYDTIDCYIGDDDRIDRQADFYNDLLVTADKEHTARLKEAGVDEVLARHVAHLFVRDPLVIFGDRICINDFEDVDHFENLQSTNWQSMRWKPPAPHKASADRLSQAHIGWRVEFRTMEVQMTDFENAAFVNFVMLLSRVILGLQLNLYIPISKLEENMQTAQHRGACIGERFWFRTDILPRPEAEVKNFFQPQPYALMTIKEVLGGTKTYPGLLPLCERYLDLVACDSETRGALKKYMDFVMDRAEGKTMTTATWMRNFVTSHPSYKCDSRVPADAAYDLMVAASEIGEGRRHCPEVLGDVISPLVQAAANPFNSKPLQQNSERKRVGIPCSSVSISSDICSPGT